MSDPKTVQQTGLTTPRDLTALGYMVSAWLATGLFPRSAIGPMARSLASIDSATRPGLLRAIQASIKQSLGDDLESTDAARLARRHLVSRHEHILGRILDTHRRGWNPKLALQGLEHLESALDKGRGAIIWGMSFCGPLVPKMALSESGIRPIHLSTPWHGGFSRSWVSLKILNRWAVATEAPYLADRVVIPADGSLSYLKRLKGCLKNNGCLSIQGENRGRKNIAVSVLGDSEELATGAPNLAIKSGATLLSMFSYRESLGHYTCVVQPPIELSSSNGRQAVVDASHEFASRLEGAIRQHPADWERWSLRDTTRGSEHRPPAHPPEPH